MAGGVDLAGLLVDAEGDDGVGVLIGGQHLGAGGADGGILRGPANGGLIIEAREASRSLVGVKSIDIPPPVEDSGRPAWHCSVSPAAAIALGFLTQPPSPVDWIST